ncbi:hypothetical protein [Bizionia myxarmorum]|uniref:DUF4421 domain-containing protein n=1 Tax=Bizionia myxarmorum TaxID=291186 RepID=A0A5D0REV3_9FLAO|nr:hypothetical protein [Bizionia myxarmorum]TYB79228.1 hypothetical protein ES674_05490 [Bizionia myxarmorum]
MKRFLFALSMCFLFTSCATILKKKTYNLHILSNESNAKLKVYDSIYNLPNKIKVTRSKHDLDLTLIRDSLDVHYVIKTSPNPTFLYLNLIGAHFAPLNYAVDFTNEKRFYYGKEVYLNTNDTLRIIVPPATKYYTDFFAETYPKNKNAINLVASLPYVNAFYLKPQGFGTKSNVGFFGISAGIEYFYEPKKYVSFKVSASTDLFVPFPAPVDYDGEYETMGSFNFALTDNIKINRFSIGYGLNYAFNTYNFMDNSDYENEIKITRKSQSFGLSTDVYFQFGRYFFVGVVYKPSLYQIQPKSEFTYEHLVSLDFAFKFPVRK